MPPAQSSDPALPADSCPAITAVTDALVLLPPGSTPPGKNSYRIKDPQDLQKLTAFIRPRSRVEAPSADTPPSPNLRVMLYGPRSIAVFGSGSGVFYFQCGSTVKGTQYASAGDLAEFQALIEELKPAPPH